MVPSNPHSWFFCALDMIFETEYVFKHSEDLTSIEITCKTLGSTLRSMKFMTIRNTS